MLLRRMPKRRLSAVRSDDNAVHLSHFVNSIALVAVVAAFGTAGYMYIEGWSWLDALYMTVITMGTIGYGEVRPLDPEGRVFTMVLIVLSIGTAGYALTIVARFVIEGEFNRMIRGRRMDKSIARLSDHIVLCGGGSTGRCIAEEFAKTGTSFVVVEKRPEALQHLADIDGILHLQGDATDDHVLLRAGIDRARGLVTALGEDKDNLYVVLSARSLNAGLRIVSRLNDAENEKKLRKAGADEVVSPNAIGGLRLASVMIRPMVVGFLDGMLRHSGDAIRVEEMTLPAASGLAGRSLADAQIGQRTGMLVMAIRSAAGEPKFNPGAQTVLAVGDTLIVMGTPPQLETLRKLATCA